MNDRKLVNVSLTSSSANVAKSSTAIPKEKQANGYCKFFNRFGRCARGDRCEQIHDPKRISLCPRFLRGTCNQANCLFSHTISAEKMPLCAYFAKGCCSRENCPYSHVYFGKEAKVCLRFARDGFCPLGSKCDRAHVNECEEFVRTLECSKGDQCPFMHRKRNLDKGSKQTVAAKGKKTTSKLSVEKQKSAEFGDSFIGFQLRSGDASVLDDTAKMEKVDDSLRELEASTRKSEAKGKFAVF